MADPISAYPEPEEISLLPSQETCFEDSMTILRGNISVCNTSETGAGKTYVTGKIAQVSGATLFVVCPVSVKTSVWEPFAARYGIPLVTIGYEKLRGMKTTGVKHPWLVRSDREEEVNGKMKNVTTYRATEEFKQLLRRGCMVVFDEAHKAKNETAATSLACFELTRAVKEHCMAVSATHAYANGLAADLGFTPNDVHTCINVSTAEYEATDAGKLLIASLTEILRTREYYGASSRVMVLSASPFDKPEHCFSFIRLMGLTNHTKLFEHDLARNEYDLSGYEDVVRLCERLNPDLTEEITAQMYYPSARLIRATVFELYVQIIKRYICTSMRRPEIPDEMKSRGFNLAMAIDNEVVYIDEETGVGHRARDLADLARVKLLRAIGGDADNIDRSNMNMGQITEAMVLSEHSKLPGMVRIASGILEAQPTAKVVLFVWTKKARAILAEALAPYKPFVLGGETKPEVRAQMINVFQEPSTVARVIIAHPKVGGVGVSLDDRHGQFPRYCLMTPHFFFIDMHQAIGRFERALTRSSAVIAILYADDFLSEARILRSVRRKSDTTRSVLHDGEDVLFQGDFESVGEDEFHAAFMQRHDEYVEVTQKEIEVSEVTAVMNALCWGTGSDDHKQL
jgi:hypothetical protein